VDKGREHNSDKELIGTKAVTSNHEPHTAHNDGIQNVKENQTILMTS
jgi:hypothetical protein